MLSIILYHFLNDLNKEMELGKMGELEDPGFTFSHKHNDAITTYNATHSESDLKTNRRALSQLKI